MALDLAEEFRPLIADSVVLTAVNNGEIGASDFVFRAAGCALTQSGRRRFIATYERRMRTELRHRPSGTASGIVGHSSSRPGCSGQFSSTICLPTGP